MVTVSPSSVDRSPRAAPSERDEALFVQRVTDRRFSRLEVPGRASIGFAASGAVWALGATALAQRGFSTGVVSVLSLTAAAFAAAAVWSAKAELLRSREDAADSDRGCYRDGQGALMPVLSAGETLILLDDARGLDARLLRKAAASAQALVGFLLAGLPLAVVAGAEPGTIGAGLILWAAVFSLLGSLLFGRGLHLAIGSRAAARMALTSQRLVAMAAPGAARCLPLAALRNKPVVVERRLGGATVAFDLVRLPSTGVLPLMGLWGLDDLPVERAKEWARAVLQARKSSGGAPLGPASGDEGSAPSRAAERKAAEMPRRARVEKRPKPNARNHRRRLELLEPDD